jgi:hypothetical protein
MKNLIRSLTLSAAALAVLVAAPKSNADGPRRTETRETFRGSPGHGESFRGEAFRGRELHGRDWHARGVARPPASFYGRRYAAPFRVFAGSRFYSYCPGPGYIYVDELGWIFPPFSGAMWIPAHVDRFGVRIGGFWR